MTLLRRFSLVLIVLVSALAGMVLTGRLRSAESPHVTLATRDTASMPRAQQVGAQAALPAAAALPDFTAGIEA